MVFHSPVKYKNILILLRSMSINVRNTGLWCSQRNEEGGGRVELSSAQKNIWFVSQRINFLEGRAGTSRAAQCNRSLDSGSFHLLLIVSALLGLFLGRIPLQTPSVKVPTRLFKSYFRVFSQIAKQVLPGFLDNLSSQILQKSQGKKFTSEKNGITLVFCTVLRKKENYLTRASLRL